MTSAAYAVEYATHATAEVAARSTVENAHEALFMAQYNVGARADARDYKEEAELRRRFLFCIFGLLPCRAISVDATWLTSTVKQVAIAIYSANGFDRLPILADALEDAGCDNADILNHCRQPGEHVRGCWVVDLLLGRQ